MGFALCWVFGFVFGVRGVELVFEVVAANVGSLYACMERILVYPSEGKERLVWLGYWRVAWRKNGAERGIFLWYNAHVLENALWSLSGNLG